MENTQSQPIKQDDSGRIMGLWISVIIVATTAWFSSYSHLNQIADFFLSLTAYDRSSHTGEAIHFFFYDTPQGFIAVGRHYLL